MADVVQYRLERMLDELDDLERKGLFTRREIAEIVKKRRGFEYKLKRPSPLKQDYIAYIEYETQLDSLRRLRKKSIVRELKKKQAAEDDEGAGRKKRKVWRRSVSDSAGVLRILEIYRLAVSRFKGDINLWFRYLEFCRECGHGRMAQVRFLSLSRLIVRDLFEPFLNLVWVLIYCFIGSQNKKWVCVTNQGGCIKWDLCRCLRVCQSYIFHMEFNA